MTSFIPITLIGGTLGARHQHLNSLVNDAFKKEVPFDSIRYIPEKSAIDSIFKIDLAAKYKNVDYILETLKGEDMLLVNRALKCIWLLESRYADIINPSYLEETLFPEMITTAANKMLHWIQLNLKDNKRNELFYIYYKEKNKFDIAIKFLLHCSTEFISNEVTVKTIHKINPKYFKILSEKYPKIALLYFDCIEHNVAGGDPVNLNYHNNSDFYNNFKRVLKVDANIFLDVIEKYFELRKPMRPNATKYIMVNHRERFNSKPELYTAYLLDQKTLGSFLSNDEIKELILKLAKAEYLNHWFSYQAIEPLIKCLPSEERNLIKNQVFVEKSFGEKVKEWPYPPPKTPYITYPEKHVFSDDEPCYLESENDYSMCCAMKSCYQSRCVMKRKTLLDTLFDEYRFMSFEKTLYELKRKIRAESSAQNREYMMLVLVSKSGGRDDYVKQLLQMLVERHDNEPANLRAAIVRSMVRRATAWRLQSEQWDKLMHFGRDLGLDGGPAVAPCYEGLHAVVLRKLLENNISDDFAVISAYFNMFSTFSEYSLNSKEKRCLRDRLPLLILEAAQRDQKCTVERYDQLLDTIAAYKSKITEYPGAVDAIVDFASREPNKARPLLQRIYDSGVARKELFKENFEFIQTSESYINVLRHNSDLLKATDKFIKLIELRQVCHERFMRKLALYYNEENGLAELYLKTMEQKLSSESSVGVARALAILANGSKLLSLIDGLEVSSKKEKHFSAILRSNLHRARPPIYINAVGWKKVGAKVVNNKLIICKRAQIDRYVEQALEWRSTLRLALLLAERVGIEARVLAHVAEKRPSAAIKWALRYFNQRGDKFDLNVWDVIKPIIGKLDYDKDSRVFLRRMVQNFAVIPAIIKPQYIEVIYNNIKKHTPLISAVVSLLPKMNEAFVTEIIKDFLNDFEQLTHDSRGYGYPSQEIILNIQCIARFLLLCENETTQEKRYETLAKQFLLKIENLWKTNQDNALKLLKHFIFYLKYNHALFSVKYVNQIPVFEKIVLKLHTFLPMDQYFDTFVEMHVTILYCKSIRYVMTHNTDIINESVETDKAVELVGTVFGKYIAHEVEELIAKYYPTIKELYQDELVRFMNRLGRGESHDKLKGATFCGFTTECGGKKVNIFSMNMMRLYKDKKFDENIINVFKKGGNEEMLFYYYARDIIAEY